MAPKTKPSDRSDVNLAELYRHRFPSEVLARRTKVWRILCRSWFAKYIPRSAHVLDVAAGYCEFINNVEAIERIAVDLNPETTIHAAPGVIVHVAAAERVADVVPHAYFDTAFISNFLEHCRSRDQVLAVLRAVSMVLKPGGRLLILGPNFRYCYKHYFDYFDHHLPLTDKAVMEALQISGFEIELVEPRTLPFTFRSRFPNPPWIVWLYLQLPYIWNIFGSQFFLVGKKTVKGTTF